MAQAYLCNQNTFIVHLRVYVLLNYVPENWIIPQMNVQVMCGYQALGSVHLMCTSMLHKNTSSVTQTVQNTIKNRLSPLCRRLGMKATLSPKQLVVSNPGKGFKHKTGVVFAVEH